MPWLERVRLAVVSLLPRHIGPSADNKVEAVTAALASSFGSVFHTPVQDAVQGSCATDAGMHNINSIDVAAKEDFGSITDIRSRSSNIP